MIELDKLFVAKNKRALLEEIALLLSKSQEYIDLASVNPDAKDGALLGLVAIVSSVTSYFKEYMLLRRGEIPTANLIGFQVFEDEKDEDMSEDLDDTEIPETGSKIGFVLPEKPQKSKKSTK